MRGFIDDDRTRAGEHEGECSQCFGDCSFEHWPQLAGRADLSKVVLALPLTSKTDWHLPKCVYLPFGFTAILNPEVKRSFWSMNRTQNVFTRIGSSVAIRTLSGFVALVLAVGCNYSKCTRLHLLPSPTRKPHRPSRPRPRRAPICRCRQNPKSQRRSLSTAKRSIPKNCAACHGDKGDGPWYVQRVSFAATARFHACAIPFAFDGDQQFAD